jgi:hypothetical protein
MIPDIRLERLTEENFEVFASLINCEDDGCYCSFWHQKISSMEEWDRRKAQEPEKNKSCMLERLRSRFHLGVLAYQGNDLVAWISVGPLTDFYWTWKRVGQLGDSAKTIAAIPCITRRSEFRDRVSEASILKQLALYGKEQGWSAIEGYPFDRETIDRLGEDVTWPGFPEEFVASGFTRTGEHWLSSPEYRRSIYRLELG